VDTNPATDHWQWIGFLDGANRIKIFSFPYLANIYRDVDPGRTGSLARGCALIRGLFGLNPPGIG
jgi:hypothetical protein